MSDRLFEIRAGVPIGIIEVSAAADSLRSTRSPAANQLAGVPSCALVTVNTSPVLAVHRTTSNVPPALLRVSGNQSPVPKDGYFAPSPACTDSSVSPEAIDPARIELALFVIFNVPIRTTSTS